MKKILVILGIIIVVGIAVFYLVKYLQVKKISSYAECEKSKYALIQMTYPATCVLPDGRSFTQPLSREEQKNLIPPQ